MILISSSSIHVSEPFIEALPQLHLLLIIGVMSYNEERFIGVSTEKNATVVPRLIWSGFGLSESGLTFLLSLASASFGVTKFIKAGPASIVRNDKWLDGFGTLTFMLINLNVSCILFTKGLIIGRLVDLIQRSKISSLNNLLIFIVFLPQCLHVSSIVLSTGLQFTPTHYCRHLVLSAALLASGRL